MENNKPIKEIKFGNIKVSVWKNEKEKYSTFSVSANKAYKTKDSEDWKYSTSFDKDEIPLLTKALDRAHSFIYEEARAK
jgi:hypothetical protein